MDSSTIISVFANEPSSKEPAPEMDVNKNPISSTIKSSIAYVSEPLPPPLRPTQRSSPPAVVKTEAPSYYNGWLQSSSSSSSAAQKKSPARASSTNTSSSSSSSQSSGQVNTSLNDVLSMIKSDQTFSASMANFAFNSSK